MTDARDALIHGLRKEVFRVQLENKELDAQLIEMRRRVRHAEELARMYRKSDKAVWFVGHQREAGFDIVGAFGNATGARRFVEEFPNLTKIKVLLGRKNAKTSKVKEELGELAHG